MAAHQRRAGVGLGGRSCPLGAQPVARPALPGHGPGRGGHCLDRPGHLPPRLNRSEKSAPGHPCPDGRGRDRGLFDWPMARGGHGDGPVRCRRAPGRPGHGPRPPRPWAIAGQHPQHRPSAAGRWPLREHSARGRAAARHRARAAGRANSAGWHHHRGFQQHQPSAHHRREHPCGQRPRRYRVGGQHQPARPAAHRRGQGQPRQPAEPHRASGRPGPGPQSAHPALCGSIRPHLHPHRAGAGHRPGRAGPVAARLERDRCPLPSAGLAGHCLPLRPGAVHTNHHRQQPDGGGPQRPAAQRRQRAGNGPPPAPHRPGQNRHPHHGPPQLARLASSGPRKQHRPSYR